jgi:hypothetical protein
MAQVLCDRIGPGFRASERSVGVRDVDGHREFLRVEEGFLTKVDGKHYLPVGLVSVNWEKKAVLIELPHEADSGAHRLWVHFADLLPQNGMPA